MAEPASAPIQLAAPVSVRTRSPRGPVDSTWRQSRYTTVSLILAFLSFCPTLSSLVSYAQGPDSNEVVAEPASAPTPLTRSPRALWTPRGGSQGALRSLSFSLSSLSFCPVLSSLVSYAQGPDSNEVVAEPASAPIQLTAHVSVRTRSPRGAVDSTWRQSRCATGSLFGQRPRSHTAMSLLFNPPPPTTRGLFIFSVVCPLGLLPLHVPSLTHCPIRKHLSCSSR